MRIERNAALLLTGSVFAIVVHPAYAQTPQSLSSSTTSDITQAPIALAVPRAQPQSTSPAAPDIVVRGIRSSLQSAQTLKRNSDAIVDAIVAEDIGKFPDNNASEALAHVAGVEVTRSADEANGVLIRGLPDVKTTLEGRDIFTADGRSVALQDFPAGALSAVEVFKSATADLLEPGIAGLINVRLRRPFDFPGLRVAGSFTGSYSDQSKEFDPNGSLLISDRWNTSIGEIGVLLDGSYTRTNYLNSTRYDDDPVTPRENQPVAGGVGHDFIYPQEVGINYTRGHRYRPSVNGSIQWRPTSSLEIHVDGLYQGYRGRSEDNVLAIPLHNNDQELHDVVLVPGPDGDLPSAASLTSQVNKTIGPSENTLYLDTDTFQGAVGANYQFGNATFKTDFSYTNSKVHSTSESFKSGFYDPPLVEATFNAGYGVDFSLPGTDLEDINSYKLRGFHESRNTTKGSEFQWSGEFALDIDRGILSRFQFGWRYSTRDASSQDGSRDASFNDFMIPLTRVPFIDEGEVIQPGFRGDLQQQQSWFTQSQAGVRDHLSDLRAYIRQQLIDTGADQSNIDDFASEEVELDPEKAFHSNEKTYTVYSQLKYDFDAGPFPVDGLLGARIIATRGNLQGNSRITTRTESGTVVEFEPVSSAQRYVDILPNISARIHFTPKLQLRLARTETLTRPAFDATNPALRINQDFSGGTTTVSASGGNPNLRPIRSNNYDASLEWYFARAGSATIAVFRRDLDGFISTYTSLEPDPIYGTLRISRPENAGTGRIDGVEATFTTFFDFLPGALSGLGVQFNGTYLDATQDLPSNLGLHDRSGKLPSVSKWTGNAILLYEKGPVSARLAYNYRDPYVTNYTAGGLFDAHYVAETSRLDFSASYDILKQVTLTVGVTNILGEPYESFYKERFYPNDVRYESRFYSAGLRFHF